MQRAWNKYGEEAFEFEVIEIGSVDLDKRELYFINLYNSSIPKHGYNISKETNNARLGHQQSKKTKKAISKKLKGIKRSDKTIKRMSNCKIGENNPMYGKKHSQEYIEKRVKNNRKQVIRNDGKVYSSLKEAAIDLNASQQSISASVRLGYKVKGWRLNYVKT
jgi:group I intron endonuclease